jgi:ubiquinone/menaquinone biosynthesis C-methylase UbiE
MEFADPMANVLRLGLHPGMKIADLGSGAGHYAIPAAHAVGEEGRVYAIDVQEAMVAHVKDAARRAGLSNLEAIWGDFEQPGGTKLRDGAMDGAVLSNVLFQIERHEQMLAELKRILRPGGKLLVIDWAGSYRGLGPAEAHIIAEHRAEELFISAGFHKVSGFRAGAHHYGLIFENPS